MLLLLSPAKKQDFDVAYSRKTTKARFVDEVMDLIECLRQFDVLGLQDLMKISASLAELNLNRYRSFCMDYSVDKVRPAVLVFQGDVYQGLQAEKFNEIQDEFLQNHVRILSGLYGVLRPFDLIQAYRLEMKTKLITPKGANLVAFWGSKIAEVLQHDLAEHEEKIIVNLASREYFKAVDVTALKARVITVDFKINKGDDLKTVGVYAKKARGMMARYVVENAITEPEKMQAFAKDGYCFNPKLSEEDNWVFVKKIKA